MSWQRPALLWTAVLAAGLALARWWTDENGDFAVSLSFKE